MSDHRDAWTAEGEDYEYGKAANPIGAGLIPKVPMGDFPASFHQDGPSRIIPFDLSETLRCEGPASSPALCSNFIRILPGESLATNPNATSEFYHVIRGQGVTRIGGDELR